MLYHIYDEINSCTLYWCHGVGGLWSADAFYINISKHFYQNFRCLPFLWTQYHNSVWKIFDFCIIHNFFVSYYKVELGHTWSQVLQWIKAVSLMLLLKLMCILMLIIRYCGVNWIFFGYKDYSCFWVKFMQLSFCIYIF